MKLKCTEGRRRNCINLRIHKRKITVKMLGKINSYEYDKLASYKIYQLNY